MQTCVHYDMMTVVHLIGVGNHITRTFIGLCDMQTCVSYDMMTVVHLIGVGNPSYNQDIYRPV